MATRTLDVITILFALQTLDHELKIAGWHPKNSAQRELFTWLERYQDHLAQIPGLEAKASRFYEELNAFLADKGFSLRLQPFDPKKELGVVSVLDKLVRWLDGPGTRCDIATRQGAKPGFELPPTGVHIYEVQGYRGSYLLELLTQSEETLWLFVHEDTSVEGLDLVKLSLDVMRRSRQTPMSRVPDGFEERAAPTAARANAWLRTSLVPRVLGLLQPGHQSRLNRELEEDGYPTFAGAKVPMIEVDYISDLRWLLDAWMTTGSGDRYYIKQASQQFKLRMDETGARVKVAALVVIRPFTKEEGPTVFIVDRPFYGWWTQRGVDVPMAAFFADWDCWRKPAGTLEDL